MIKLAGKSWLAFIVLFLGGLAAYATALNGKFLYDDTWLVGGNPFYKSPVFVFEVFRHYLFLDSLSFYYRPVQNITYMLDYWLWYSGPFGYHLSNIIYHVLSGFLLYLLLKRLLPTLATAEDWRRTGVDPADSNNFLALLVSLLWVVHPIHNAAVAYVSGRADSVACVFALCAWLLYIRASASGALWVKIALQALALALCVLGICSKEICIIWMAVFLFHLFVFNKAKSLPQKIGALLGVGLVVGVYLVLRHLPGGSPMPGAKDAQALSMRFILMLRALGDYTSLLFYPTNLHMDRIVFSPVAYTSPAEWANFIRFEYLSVIGTVMILVFILMGRSPPPGRRLRVFAAWWFIIGFLPISNLFPLNAQVAEHWIYMPSMGLILFFAGCALALPQNFRVPAAALAALAVIPLTIRTSARAAEWADPERFFRQTINSGGGTTRINLNLAMIYYNNGDYPKAEALMRDIVKRFPYYMPAKLDLGMTLAKEGKEDEAKQYLEYDKKKTEEMSTQYVHTWSAAVSMIGIKLKQKKYDEAQALAEDAVKQYPGQWEVLQARAAVLGDMGRLPEAIAVLKTFTDTHWWHYDSFMTLGKFYAINGDAAGAIAAYEHAATLDIHNGEPFIQISHVDTYLLHQPDAAREAQITALTRNPNLSKMLNDLDRAHQQLDDAFNHGAEPPPPDGKE